MEPIFTISEVDLQLSPVSAISRIVCLMAQIILSIKSLNWFGGMVNSAKQKRQNVAFQDANYGQLTRETMKINRAKELEEADAMLGELSKVLIYHI